MFPIQTKMRCDLPHKISKIKANHNRAGARRRRSPWCDLPHKISKIKANHNSVYIIMFQPLGVIYHTKLVKSKQITTEAFSS